MQLVVLTGAKQIHNAYLHKLNPICLTPYVNLNSNKLNLFAILKELYAAADIYIRSVDKYKHSLQQWCKSRNFQ